MNERKEMLYQVKLLPEHRTFGVRCGESVLDAALHVGINLPHSCKGGSCGACRARLLKGTVSYPFGTPLGISSEEEAQGYVLLCEARPTSDLQLDIREIRAADDVEIKDLPCRIARKQLLAPDVMALFLQLPAVEVFKFMPGQYLDVMLPGERRRSFSIASPPHDSRLIELHVRRTPGGEFSQRVFEDLPEKSLLRIEGPLGQFFYRHPSVRPQHSSANSLADRPASDSAAMPVLLIGGGTGFAPLKSIIRHVLENGLQRRLHLYWGARTAQDLYEDELVRQWAAAHDNFRYTPVLSEAGPDAAWTGRVGFVHEAALADYADLSNIELYASGPPALIEAIKRDGLPRGLAPERLHFDSFEYAPDALEKMRKQTKASSL